ncbi:MAG: pilus assembly protein N-terminal domain-containing protein [Nitratireductor sp.]
MNNDNNKKANVMQSLGNTWKSAATAFVLVGLALATPLAMPLAAQAEESVVHLSPSRNTKTIQIPSAQPRTFRADASFSEIVVGDPEVAVVTPLTDRSFYVVGSKAGTTGVALYNEAKELVGMLDIEVGPDTAKLNRTIADTGVKAQSANGRVVLTGKARVRQQQPRPETLPSSLTRMWSIHPR